MLQCSVLSALEERVGGEGGIDVDAVGLSAMITVDWVRMEWSECNSGPTTLDRKEWRQALVVSRHRCAWPHNHNHNLLVLVALSSACYSHVAAANTRARSAVLGRLGVGGVEALVVGTAVDDEGATSNVSVAAELEGEALRGRHPNVDGGDTVVAGNNVAEVTGVADLSRNVTVGLLEGVVVRAAVGAVEVRSNTERVHVQAVVAGCEAADLESG